MSLAGEILEELLSITIRYKGIPTNIFGIPRFGNYPYGSVKTTLYRLRRKGYLEKDENGWILTEPGKRFARDYTQFQSFESPFEKGAKRDLIVMFDVSEEKRNCREWLREQLKEFGYVMIQRSVWAGPSPLPKEFKDYIKKLNLKSSIKTFKLAKAYK